MEARLPSHPILAILAILRQTIHPIQTILRHTILRHTILAIHTTILQTKWRPMRPSHYPYQTGRRRAKQPWQRAEANRKKKKKKTVAEARVCEREWE